MLGRLQPVGGDRGASRFSRIAPRLGRHSAKLSPRLRARPGTPSAAPLPRRSDRRSRCQQLLLAEHRAGRTRRSAFVRTVDAIERELLRGKHVMRYASEGRFGLPETTFIVCRFWLIDAWWRSAVANRLTKCSGALRYRNRYGLLSEDIHPETGALWGNFPQTYSMAGLILTAMRLSRNGRIGIGAALSSFPTGLRSRSRDGASAPAVWKWPLRAGAEAATAGVWFGWSGRYRGRRRRADAHRSHKRRLRYS